MAKDVGRRDGRRGRAGRGAVVEPHAVSRAGQDRPDDRDHVGPPRPAQDRRHRAAELLHLRHQRARAQGGRHQASWEDLRGKPVCGKQGAFYNKIVTERYGAKIVAFTGNAEAKQALRDKKCIAWVYDDSSIMSDLSSGNWDDLRNAARRPRTTTPGVWPCRSAEKDCVFGNFMSGMTYQLAPVGPADRAGKEVGDPADAIPEGPEREVLRLDSSNPVSGNRIDWPGEPGQSRSILRPHERVPAILLRPRAGHTRSGTSSTSTIRYRPTGSSKGCG